MHRTLRTSLISLVLLIAIVVAGFVFLNGQRFQYPSRPNTLMPSPSPLSLAPMATPSPKPVLSQAHGRILMYHYIREGVDRQVDPIGYNLSIPPAEFEQQIALLTNLGYKPMTMADLVAGKGTKKSIALTFDDGYEDFYTSAYPILKKYNWTATLYIITGKLGDRYMTVDQLKELGDYGMEIGAHTVNHIDLAHATLEKQTTEITRSKLTLEKIIGKPITTFAYPSGQYTADTISIVKAAGFTSAVTTHPGIASPTDSAYELPRVRIAPSLTLSLFQKELQ